MAKLNSIQTLSDNRELVRRLILQEKMSINQMIRVIRVSETVARKWIQNNLPECWIAARENGRNRIKYSYLGTAVETRYGEKKETTEAL